MANIFFRAMGWFLIERKTKNKTYSDYKTAIESSAAMIENLIDTSTQDDKSHRELTHVIGMERWMQNRLKVALGEPFKQDEYDDYRPAKDSEWTDLKQQFTATRQATVEICDELQARNIDGTQKVEHNQFGDVSVKGWLEYLLVHGDIHAKRMTVNS